jgi:hypothetical protein
MLPIVSVFTDKVGSKVKSNHFSVSPLKVVCGDGFARIGDGCALDTVNNLLHFDLLLYGFGFWCCSLWFTPLLYHTFFRLSTPFLKIFFNFF